MAELKKGIAQFQLIGKAKITDFTYKIDEHSAKKNSDWIYNQLNLGVDCGLGNTVYSDLMGGYGSERDNVLYVHGTKENDKGKIVDDYKNKYEIDWEDRKNESVISEIGKRCFITIGLEKDKKDNTFAKKFLSAYDAIEYIKTNLVEGTVINVKGNLVYSIYNDATQVKKEITSIFLSRYEEEKDFKATFSQTILINKDSVGKFDKEKKSFPIYAKVIDYTKSYNDKVVKQNIPFNYNFEINLDISNPENTKNFITKIFKVKKNITSIDVLGNIIESQVLINVSKEDIPKDIQDLISYGVYTEEEALNKLVVGGSRTKKMVICKPVIKMVGDDKNKIPKIMMTESKYKEKDLFFDFMIEDENKDSESTDTIEKKSTNKILDKIDEKEEDDDMAWLKELGD